MMSDYGREETQRIRTGGLARWGRFCASHPWRVISTWIVAFVAVVFLSASFGATLIDEFTLPGSESQKATDLVEEKFPARKGATLQMVFSAPQGERLDTPERRAAVERAVAEAEAAPGVTGSDGPFDDQRFSDEARVGYADVYYDELGFDIPRENVTGLQDDVRDIVRPAGVQAEFTGDAEQSPPEQGIAELLGFAMAFIVLMIVFRTLVATFVPLGLALISVGTAFSLLFLLANLTNFNTVTPILVSMIGIGVGIDYSLFIVTRFRQSLHDGLSPKDAAALATATAGRAVIFAGATVAISITGLVVIGMDFITKMGFGGALGVLTSVLAAVTLLPAVLAKLGHKVDRLRIPGMRHADDSEAARSKSIVARWGRAVVNRPTRALVGGLVALIVLAIPIAFTQLGVADAGTAPKDTTTRQAYDLLAEGFGAGYNGPIPIVVDQSADPDAAERIAAALEGRPEIEFVADPVYNRDENPDVAIVNVVPPNSPQDSETEDLVNDLRSTYVPEALAGSPAQAYVSGLNAAFLDIGDKMLSRAPYFLLYIIGVTFLLISMAFRSVVVAIKASLTTVMSALVGFGVLTLVMHEGVGLSLVGLDQTGPIETFIPPIAFAILFGLSMDYEVFLMSRVREEHVHGRSTRDALTHGIAAIGRVVIAAALIMTTVFLAFLLTPDRVSKEFGLLLAVAILVDALIMRLTIVPALLSLLRERTWYMPRWLDRLLPDITVEPPAEHQHPSTPPPEPVRETG